MRGAITAAALLAAGGLAASAHGDELTAARQRLAAARAARDAASRQAAALDRQAAGERDAARAAATQERAVAARITRAEAAIAAAEARRALVAALLARQRAELGRRQEPVARLLAALQSLAGRPPIATIAQPGSLDDLVHVRAVLGSTLPAIRARTADVRADLADTRRLEAEGAAAGAALAQARAALIGERRTLATLRAAHDARAGALGRDALAQSDRAIALGEAARDIVDQIEALGGAQATQAALADLSGPPASDVAPGGRTRVYRLPVAGRLVTGLGELSDAGVRARGLTFATAPGAAVIAPAGGRIVFARAFRGYGLVAIVDHGAGWTTLVSGLGRLAVRSGQTVRAGARLGEAGAGEAPRVTVELRRGGRPVDIVALVG